MSGQHDEHDQNGHGGHGAPSMGEWLDTHLSGAIVPFGDRVEKLFENTMFLIVNGFMIRIAIACLVIMTPVLLLEFILRAVRM